MPPNPDQLDPDWHRYPDTVLHFQAEPAVSVDLRQPVGVEARSAMELLGLAGPFAVMTAHDPRGRDESPEVNERRAEELDRRLAALGVPFVHVDACSPDRSHCEASVAAVMDREAATALGRELEQVAIFWYDGEKFWIVGAVVGGDPIMLPRPT